MSFVFNDGGRQETGRKGIAGDCVTRAIAIAAELDYAEVYNALFDGSREHANTKRDKVARRLQTKRGSPRNGVYRPVYDKYIKSLGWVWHPTMLIGQGCKVHLNAEELPTGRLIVLVSKHMVAVIDGVIHDTYDPSRDGKRCVYGYYTKQ